MKGFVLFLAFFMSVYGGMNFYVLARLAALLSWKRTPWFYAAWLALSLSYLAAAVISRNLPGVLARLVYLGASLWMGFMFITMTILVVYDILRIPLRLNHPRAGIIVLCLGLLLSLFAFINALFLRVRRHDISSSRITESLVIAHISDLHLGPILRQRAFRRIVGKVNSLNPDLILITGDLLDGPYDMCPADMAPLRDFTAPAFMITGNHERYAGPAAVEHLLLHTSLQLLSDQTVEFRGVDITGIGDSDRRDHLKFILSDKIRNPERYNIALYHRPTGAADAAAWGADLMLCGHTHAGQIFPFNFIVGFFFRPVRGRHDINGMNLIVSTGTGTWGPPMRLGSSSEINLICLSPAP